MKRLGIAFTGGGAHGATQAGMLLQLIRLGHHPRVVSGTSVGAITTLAMALYWARCRSWVGFPEWFTAQYARLSSRRVYREHRFGVLTAFRKGGFYDATPLRELLTSMVGDGSILRTVDESEFSAYVTAVNITTGYQEQRPIVGEYAEDVVDWVMRSAAYPMGFLPERDEQGDLWLDGGLREIAPVELLIDHEAHLYRIIVCHTTPKNLGLYTEGTRLDRIGLRCLEIMTHEIRRTDIVYDRCQLEDIELLELFPDQTFGSSFDFSPLLNVRRMAEGVAIVERAKERGLL